MQNDTGDENVFAIPHSADAMNDHTVESREIQDSLSSSVFFQQQRLIILKQFTFK